MKKSLSFLLVFVLALSLMATPAYAMERTTETDTATYGSFEIWTPSTRWSYTQSVIHGVIVNGGKATFQSDVQLYSRDNKVSVKTELLQLTGSGWKVISSVSGSGTFYSSCSKTVSVSFGTYRTRTTGSVYNAKGAYLEAIDIYSNIVEYKG